MPNEPSRPQSIPLSQGGSPQLRREIREPGSATSILRPDSWSHGRTDERNALVHPRQAREAAPTPFCAIFIGDNAAVVECAVMARRAGIDVQLLVMRGHNLIEQARQLGFATESPNGLGRWFDANTADVLFSIANERVLSADVLSRVGTALNFHDGPLPAYAGLAVTTWAILNGETEHGITWHTMTDQVDRGEVIASQRFAISPTETAFSLNARCYEAVLETFPDVLDRLLNVAEPPIPQSDGAGRWFGRYDRPIGFLDPSRPSTELDRVARSLDLGHRVRNRVGTMRWVVDDELLLVEDTTSSPSDRQAQGVVAATGDGVRITTADGDLVVGRLLTASGDVIDAGDLPDFFARTIDPPDRQLVDALTEADRELARNETFWSLRLADFQRSAPAVLDGGRESTWYDVKIPVPADASPHEIAACVLSWWVRTSDATTVWFEYSDANVELTLRSLAPLVQRPVGRLTISGDTDWASAVSVLADEIEVLSSRGPFLRDLIARTPDLRHNEIDPAIHIAVGPGETSVRSRTALLEATIAPSGGGLVLSFRNGIPAHTSTHVAEQMTTLLTAGRTQPSERVQLLDTVGPEELRLIDSWNQTSRPVELDTTIDAQFRRRVELTPDQSAVTAGDNTLTYAELRVAVDVLAERLIAAGAGPGTLVGIALERDVDLVVSTLAVLTVGAAYVPLDPAYPDHRLASIIVDSGLAMLVAEHEVSFRPPGSAVTTVNPRDPNPAPQVQLEPSHRSDDLAYVIYTSGSTGQPKGVMVEHRNVVNFFAAMDRVIEHDSPGRWLAVTSLSFDISVLELLWTLTRGFHVVIDKGRNTPSRGQTELAGRRREQRATSLSLFFFAADDAVAADGYRLLRESARFADHHGFEAVWLPERHFHAFGGAYPNPSVLAAAVATVTERVAIRAGSVVLPIHSPIRVAEEWAVVDNLSGGRTGISFAPGWQPNDFVLNPDAYRGSKDDLQRQIEQVRALWRGDSIDMMGPDDRVVSVRTLPRPVQAELPVWLTSAGTTETFERAGAAGFNLLTHLLGQSIDQLAHNIAVYRAAWRDAGHPGRGHITVMLHTYLHGERDHAGHVAEAPMKRYLATATGLLKDMASTFPTFANAGEAADEAFRSLSDLEMDELLSIAARRYLDDSGLIGDLDHAEVMALNLSDIGTDEIACLIDFGIATDHVLESLPMLADLKGRLERRATQTDPDDAHEQWDSIADLIERHEITHLQCTPSLAAMLLADPRDRKAIGAIDHLMVGGEALPQNLGRELREHLSGRLTNMYGPTETTIWSLVHEIETSPTGQIPIGRPVTNTTIHVLDPQGKQRPIGALGELHIGGAGVARGYLGREGATAERFVNRPGIGRVYATGDLARLRPDGAVEFAGRTDFQVKIRGHRIELEEIEAQLDRHPTVDRSVVVARSDGHDTRLVAFVVPEPGSSVDEQGLRDHVRAALPDVMIPDLVVPLSTLPLTPNGKVDRAALPTEVGRSAHSHRAEVVPPEDDFERLVAATWTEHLDRPVGRTDNFFDLGGHSLLAVAVFRSFQESTEAELALTDVFRYPTVATFAAHLKRVSGPDQRQQHGDRISTGTDRGTLRRDRLNRRRDSTGDGH